MKHVVFCMVLSAFVGTSALAQDNFPQDAIVPLDSRSTQKRIFASQFESQDKTTITSSTRWNPFTKLTKPVENPFIVFVGAPSSAQDEDTKEEKATTDPSSTEDQGFQWSTAIKQSLVFLGVQHGYALTQPKTKRDLKGPFFKDYINSVKSLRGWEDGGKFFTNYIAHPMQGSFLGFIQIQNDPKGKSLRFNESGAYWRSRLKALAWSAAWSTQFEIGPVSQASIGNVGLHGKQTYVDIVMTPTAGFGLLVLEDFLDQKLIRKLERSSTNYYLRISTRMFLNPTRSVANLLRLKVPWYRDEGLRSDTRATFTPASIRTRRPK